MKKVDKDKVSRVLVHQIMFFIRKQIKRISTILALTLFLAGILVAAHHHSSLKNEKDSNCSICLISHSNTKTISPSPFSHFVDLKPFLNPWVLDLPILVSEIPHSLQIRGPPSFI